MFWRRKRPSEDFQEEIHSHLELEADDLQQEGIGSDQAPSAARRTFGNVASLQEKYYERGRLLWLDHFSQDLRYAVRALYRSPGFALAATVTLALGIGANAAIFSVVNAVLLRPLPYLDPDRIVVLEPFWKNTGKTGTVVSAPDFHDWRSQNRVFEHLAYHSGGEGTAVVNGVPSFVQTQIATPAFFPVFGLPPAVGRFWSEQEHRTPVAVLSHRWAQDQFGDVQAAVGKTIIVYGKSLRVIGVASPGFHYPGKSDVWMPAGLFSENQYRSGHNYLAIGRLKPGVSLAAARQDMRLIADRLERQYPENRFKSIAVTPLHDKLAVGAETTLWVLLGAVFGVLLIACANVANLQLARDASRTREMAMRSALGAGRGRIVRQLLTESTLLAGLGALSGLALAAILLRAVLAIAPADIPGLDQVRIDGPVLLFVLALAGICTALFGLAPARKASTSDLNAALRQGSSRGAAGSVSNRLRAALVVAQLSVSVILLAGAGLLLRSFVALTHVDLGFSTERRLLVAMSIPVNDEDAARHATEFHRDLIAQTRTLPGVRRAAGVTTLPFTGRRSSSNYSIEGGPTYRRGEEPSAQMQVVTGGYFETMGISLRSGRDFSDGDSWGHSQVAIINESLAREAFGKENPLGRRMRCGMSPQSMNGMEVIGVVGDTRQIAPGEPPKPEMFLPYLQHPFPGSRLTLVVQTRLEPYALSAALRRTARNLNPELPVRFTTMSEVVHEALAYPRFRGVLIGCFAFLALGLSVVGIYGVISYLVGQRTSEIGLRLALGARPQDVFRLIIGGSMRLVIWGLLLGLAGTFALSRALQTLLFGIGPEDPLTIAGVIAILSVAALLGTSIPALRAARLEPLVALRHE